MAWWWLVACGSTPLLDGAALTVDTAVTLSASSEDPADPVGVEDFAPCTSDAACAAGRACRPVAGYAYATCSPPCDPAADDGACGVGVCLSDGWCAPPCDEDCPGCVDVGGAAVCAGEYVGGYQACATADDCPWDGACYVRDGAESGACAPWCVTSECPQGEVGVAASPVCLDLDLELLSCALACQEDADCPSGLDCVPLFPEGGLCLV